MRRMAGKIVALIIVITMGLISPLQVCAEKSADFEKAEYTQEVQQKNDQNDINEDGTINSDDNTENKGLAENDDSTGKNLNDEMLDKDTSENEMKNDSQDEAQSGSESETENSEENKTPDVKYEVHMQNIGWMASTTNGEIAGNDTGANHMEAIRIQVPREPANTLTGSVVYQTHVSDIGWQNEVADGELAGTTGRDKAVEAVRIRLTEQLGEAYDIYYRVCIEKKGWLGWAKNGELAGSVGYARGVKAIQIELHEKTDENKPVQDKRSYLTEENMGDVICQAHVSDIGWQNEVIDGTIAGTTGKNKAVESFKIKLSDDLANGNVIYRAHVSGIGWQNEVSNGEMAGTTGQAKAVEAFSIRLDGDISNEYDIYYRAHISNYGWLGWAKNGEVSGSEGYALKVEALQIKLVNKESSEKPEQKERAHLAKYCISQVDYQAHVSGTGWQDVRHTGDIIGTTGCGKSIEAVAMAVKPNNVDNYSGGIRYRVYSEKNGWSNWMQNGDIAGTTGQAKKVEAIQIQLTGEMEKYCDIYYKGHVANIGWLGWAKNGEIAGSKGFSYGLEAFQVVIVPRNTAAPGSVNDHYREKQYDEMELKANFYSSSTPYLILVNRSVHKVYVFQGYRGNWKKIREWYCSDGASSSPTVEGAFKVQSRGYYFDSGAARCYWWTQFYGNYLFHSVLYNKNGTLMDGRLGMALSHGCVRLAIENAKWIYDTIPSGTTVIVCH